MIPKFPEFKKLELSDRVEIEKFTSKFDPYSDFNFVEMWSWDLENQVEISLLNDNLVICPNDIFSDTYSLSYLGNNNLTDTLDKLFEYLAKKGEGESILKFVPEISLRGIDLDKYLIEIDIPNCDYVYEVSRLENFSGSIYAKKRNKAHFFLKNYPMIETRYLDINNEAHVSDILKLNNGWVENRLKSDAEFDIKGEPLALDRFLMANFTDVICVALYHDNQIIAYSIFTVHKPDYAISHFTKASTVYKGIYEYLLQICSVELSKKEICYLNYLEDMGLPGLRAAKNAYRPIKFLRKYSIRLR